MKKYKKRIALALFFITTLFSQFKPNFVPKGARDKGYVSQLSLEGMEEAEGKLKHNQIFSASLYFSKGAPSSIYSYTNVFTYNIIEGLDADIKLHGRFINNAYHDLWGNNADGGPSFAGSAGLTYSPVNNGVFDIRARTFHDKAWSGQAAYITMFGIPIKRLYRSKSFSHYSGPPIDY